MADNYAFSPGTGTIGASNDIGGVQYPRVKLTQGAAGTATDVSSAAPLPVVNSGGTITIAAGTITVVTGITNTVTIAGSAANAGGTVTISAGTVTIAAGTLTAITSVGTLSTVTVVNAVTAISNALPAGTNAIGTVTITGFATGAGSATAATTRVVVVNEQVDGSEYTAGAAGTTTIMGPTGATGDFLSYVTVFPQAAACGSVTIKDSATVVGSFPGGATTALPTLVPFTINIGANSLLGRWSVVTGGSVTILGVGNFT